PRGMQNGSCGYESETGRCDVNPRNECVWDIIRERVRDGWPFGTGAVPPRNWSLSAGGGMVRIRSGAYLRAGEGIG
ncbi:methylenetetrahydrofolate reductase C-terminal domain-containing protein, partial [bacterium]|nr:methylenetetrahydrofolate reductase C-terminal domain-containing protein [candidate division CSSED10-310 bacterium]